MRPLNALASEAADLFGYLIVCAPDLPAEDETTLAKEFERLRGLVQSIRERIDGDDRKERLALVLVEVRSAFSGFEGGREMAAASMLQLAEVHFREAWEGRTAPKRVFTADTSGGISVENKDEGPDRE